MMAAERGDLKIVSVLADSQANLEIANKVSAMKQSEL